MPSDGIHSPTAGHVHSCTCHSTKFVELWFQIHWYSFSADALSAFNHKQTSPLSHHEVHHRPPFGRSGPGFHASYSCSSAVRRPIRAFESRCGFLDSVDTSSLRMHEAVGRL